MTKSTLASEIITLIKSESNKIPAPARCVITKLYDDNVHCDVETPLGQLKYIDVIGSNIELGSNAVILFFDESYKDYVVIADTKTLNPCNFDVDEGTDELVFSFCGTSSGGGSSGEGVDIDTVKRLINDRITELSIGLNVDTMSNGYMRFDVELNKEE